MPVSDVPIFCIFTPLQNFPARELQLSRMHGMHTIGEYTFIAEDSLAHDARLTGKYPMAIEDAVKKYGKAQLFEELNTQY
jgi:hypothetical protein